jgi:TonB family protein
MIGKTTNHSPYLKLQGANIEFFPNGKKRAIRNFIDDAPGGDVTEYYPNGRIYIIGMYNNFHKMYITECRDSTGKVLAENGNGYCLRYDEDFKRVFAEGNITNSIEEGDWHGQLNDSIKYVCTYENGVIKKGISYNNRGKEYPFSQMEVEPVFKGGIEAFYKFLRQNVHYPTVAKLNNLQGKVFISFVIERDGSLTNIRIVRSIRSGCDEEAARAIKLSPPWISGTQYGVPVRVQYTTPISFTLQASR